MHCLKVRILQNLSSTISRTFVTAVISNVDMDQLTEAPNTKDTTHQWRSYEGASGAATQAEKYK
jgi:hypothetical protein